MPSRKIADLHPTLQKLYGEWRKKCVEAGLNPIITCTARTYQEQVATYAQGRESIEKVNQYRTLAGLAPIGSDENKIVTWTLKSKHITYPGDVDIEKHYSRAFDFALVKEGKPYWDIKVSVDTDEVPDYLEAGMLGEEIGLIWGGHWKSPDYCHLQLPD